MIEDIKITVRATATKLRASVDATEYQHLVLGLSNIKYNSAPHRDLNIKGRQC